MSAVFLRILNMSITAGWLILAVILIRPVLKRAPKYIICLLWALVGIRLVYPFSFQSVLSIIPSSETIPENIMFMHQPAIDSGITIVNETVNHVITGAFTPRPIDSANPLQIVIPLVSVIWLMGIAVMLGYALISYLRLKKTVSASIPVREGIFSCDEIRTPFILGIFRPVIYVPSSMGKETLTHVIRHETAHLQRHDHWWKPLGFLLLSVYWFHPLCWIAYILLCRDIEAACDEKVIRDMGREDIAAYSQALLDCSFPRRSITACPLAFGEAGVKERVKGVLNYRKPAFLVILTAVIACFVLAVCLMTDPFSDKSLSGRLGISMDMAVSAHHGSPQADGHFLTADYDVLQVRRSGNETTVYAWVLCEEYSYDGRDVKLESGSHIPAAITFDTSADDSDVSAYPVIEYWQPRDGSYYAEDIKARFPWLIQRKVLDPSGAEAQHENCLQAAREYFSVNTGNSEPDLSFLNYENAMSLIADVTDVQTIYYPPAESGEQGLTVVNGYVNGNALARYLDLVSWKERNPPRENLSVQESIQFCIQDDYRITVFKQAETACVMFRNQYRYYRIQDGDYDQAVALFYTERTAGATGETYMITLKTQYPEYFDLDTSKGLEVYVWQMSPNSYSCGVMSGTNREKTFEEMMNLKGTTIEEMRAILSAYDIPQEDIAVIPWQNPVSSYLGDYWITRSDEDPEVTEKRRQEYVEMLREMLLGTADVKTSVAYVNWTEGGMMRDCLNAEKMIISSVRHLPVYKLDTAEDLARFRESYKDILTFDHGYDEVPSFDEVTADYDDSFFADRTVLLAYVSANSGSYRYAVQEIAVSGSQLCMNVIQTNDPEVYTADMAGWLVIAEFNDTDLENITEFDAVLMP